MTSSLEFSKWFRSGFKPPAKLSVTEWANRHRVLSSRASAEPGQYRSSRTPYAEDIMNALSSSDPCKEIVFMKGAQVGATEIGNNWLGYIIDHSPSPFLMVIPSDVLAKRASKQRIAPMIDESPRLRMKVKPARMRDSGNTTLMKDFPGGTLILAGANAPTGLRSMPARCIFFDEIDAYPEDSGGEGSPIELAKARARTFARKKFFYVSTPTIEGRSKIAVLFEASDQRFFYVPCPHCHHFQDLKFKHLKWDENDPTTARYECESCKKPIYNWQKTEMLKKGFWKASKKSKIKGFHLNALYSPAGWYSWEELVEDWIKAQKDTSKLKAFMNTVLGEVWKDKGDAPDFQRLYERAESYPIGTLTDGALLLFAGVDVQKDRLEVEVWAVGRDLKNWSVEYFIIHGSPDTNEVWEKLDEIREKQFESADKKKKLKISITAVDSGYATQAVYNYARTRKGSVIAIKGRSTQQAVISSGRSVEVKYNGQRWRKGVHLFTVGVDELKTELYRWLAINKNEDGSIPPKYCHFPKYKIDYFKGLAAEELTIKRRRGYPTYVWEKIYERNEPLDCRIYARAAASMFGIDRFKEKEWDRIEQSVKESNKKNNERPESSDNIKGGIPTKRSSFWD